MRELFGEEIRKPNNGLIRSDIAAMEGGSYYLSPARKELFIDALVKRKHEGKWNLGLVPNVDDKCIFFADIDSLPAKYKFNDFLNKVATIFNLIGRRKNISVDCTSDSIIVFKKLHAEKYHIYIPKEYGITTFKERKSMWKTINMAMGHNIIDTAAHTIRFEGFNKWDKKEHRFIPHSYYKPRGEAASLLAEELYDKIWLNPRGWQPDVQYDALLDKYEPNFHKH